MLGYTVCACTLVMYPNMFADYIRLLNWHNKNNAGPGSDTVLKISIPNVSSILVFSESDPSVYEEYYTSLKAFIDNSLDVHKVLQSSLTSFRLCVLYYTK